MRGVQERVQGLNVSNRFKLPWGKKQPEETPAEVDTHEPPISEEAETESTNTASVNEQSEQPEATLPPAEALTEKNLSQLPQEEIKQEVDQIVATEENPESEQIIDWLDLRAVTTVEEMNDMLYKVSSYLVQDRTNLSKWIAGI